LVSGTTAIWQSCFCVRWQFGKTVYFLAYPTMNNLGKATMGKWCSTRKLGQTLNKRVNKPIIFKEKKVKPEKADLSSTFEEKAAEPKPQNINDIFETLTLMLKNIGVSMEKFCQFAENPI
jgi:hypothetical protein